MKERHVYGKETWLDKESRLRQKLQDKNKFKSFQCVLSFSLLCSHGDLYPAFLGRECGILIAGVVMCWGKLGASGV